MKQDRPNDYDTRYGRELTNKLKLKGDIVGRLLCQELSQAKARSRAMHKELKRLEHERKTEDGVGVQCERERELAKLGNQTAMVIKGLCVQLREMCGVSGIELGSDKGEVDYFPTVGGEE